MDSSEERRDNATIGPVETGRLRRDLEDERQRNLRLLGDFDNYRRRVERERGAACREGRRAAILAFLTALDTLGRAPSAAATHRLFRVARVVVALAPEQIDRWP